MTFLGILIIVILVVSLFGDRISQWFKGFMARRAEDAMRRMMGMPSRKEERRARKEAQQRAERFHSAGGHTYNPRRDNGPIIPGEYAEDVEFVEIKEYSETTRIHADEQEAGEVYHESQVEEADYIEIKK